MTIEYHFLDNYEPSTITLKKKKTQNGAFVDDNPLELGIPYVRSLWLFNIAMGNDPFIDGLPIKNGDFPWLC